MSPHLIGVQMENFCNNKIIKLSEEYLKKYTTYLPCKLLTENVPSTVRKNHYKNFTIRYFSEFPLGR